jgi:hypothetical protein
LFFPLLPLLAVLTAAEPPSKLPALKLEQYADPKAAAATADEVEKAYAGQPKPEAVRMLLDILRGPKIGAHNGMPARMYVIDGHRKVAYKSGRGPFGFRVGEMEQALIMALMESEKGKSR